MNRLEADVKDLKADEIRVDHEAKTIRLGPGTYTYQQILDAAGVDEFVGWYLTGSGPKTIME